MLDILVFAFVAVLVGCGGGGAGGDPTSTGGTSSTGGGTTSSGGSGVGSISGTIVDGSTGAPLEGATVTAAGKSGTSQGDGSYTLAGVPSGSVQVIGSSIGRGSKTAVAFVNTGATVTVNLVLGASSGGGGGGGGSGATGPVISSSNPSNNASGIDPTTQILFSLDQTVQADTLTAAGSTSTPSVVFTRLTSPSVTDTGAATVTPSGLPNTFIYAPGSLAPLLQGTRYALTITNRLKGVNGQPSPGSMFTFGTAGSPDTDSGGSGANPIPPRLSFTSPLGAATGVDPDSRVVFGFDRAMRNTTLTVGPTGSIVFTKTTPPSQNDSGGKLVIPTDLSIQNSFEYIPGTLKGSSGLSSATTYSLFVTNKVLSSAGVPSPGESFTFTVKRQDSGSAPTIVDSNPANGSTGIDTATRVFITLSDNVSPTTVNATSVKFSQLTTPAGPLSVNIVQAQLSPPVFEITNLPSLTGNTEYQVAINNEVMNTQGVRSQGSSVTFRTRDTSTGGGPIVVPKLAFVGPPSGAIDVDPGARIIFSFDTPMNTATVNVTSPAPNVVLTQITPPSQNDAPAAIIANPPDLAGIPNVFEYKPGTFAGGLTAGSMYTLFVTNRVLSAAGVPSNGQSFTFTVKELSSGAPPVGPKLDSSNPPKTTPIATNVDPSTQLQVTFNKDIFLSTEQRALVLNSTVNPGTLIFTRISVPAEVDSPITVTPTEAVTVTLFSGVEAQAIVGAGNPIPLSGVNVVIPGPTFGNQLPIVFRPDPIAFPRTFRYVPGRLPIQAGLVTYRLSITNGLRDAQGAAAFTDNVDFQTRLATVGPGTGPRVVATNPGTAAFVGVTSDVFITFDQPVDPASFAGGLGAQCIVMNGIAIPQQPDCSLISPCDLRQGALNGDAITCVCVGGNDTASVVPTADPRTIRARSIGGSLDPAKTIFVKINNSIFSLPDTSGITRTAPGDAFFFFTR